MNYVPTPIKLVKRMLSSLKQGDVHYDLGSGDGRFVVEAIKKGAVSTGFELDAELVRKTKQFGCILEQDYMSADLSKADLITAFLENADEVVEKFNKEGKKGARLVIYTQGKIIRIKHG